MSLLKLTLYRSTSQVTPGVPTSFVQQVVHLDKNEKKASLLGEIHKSYVMTPDVDRLLEQLRLNDGKVPGETDPNADHSADGLVRMKNE